MQIDLCGKTAIVTASTAGIGLAKGLAAAGGASVVLNGRGQAAADQAIVKVKASRVARSSRVSPAIYVASPLSSATSGAALRVDGGVVDTIA